MMAKQPQRFQVVVAANKMSIDALNHILANIESLKRLNAVFVPIKAPKEGPKLEVLVKKGITNTPTVIMPNGNLIVGLEAITDLVNRNVKKLEMADMARAGGLGGGGFTRTGDEIGDWQLANLMQGIQRNPRRDDQGRFRPPPPPQDDDDEMGEGGIGGAKFMRAMQDMESRRRIPTRQDDANGFEDGGGASRRRRGDNRGSDDYGRFRNVGDDQDYEPDFAEPAPRTSGRRPSGGGARRGNAANMTPSQMEDAMFEALMDKQGHD